MKNVYITSNKTLSFFSLLENSRTHVRLFSYRYPFQIKTNAIRSTISKFICSYDSGTDTYLRMKFGDGCSKLPNGNFSPVPKLQSTPKNYKINIYFVFSVKWERISLCSPYQTQASASSPQANKNKRPKYFACSLYHSVMNEAQFLFARSSEKIKLKKWHLARKHDAINITPIFSLAPFPNCRVRRNTVKHANTSERKLAIKQIKTSVIKPLRGRQ